MSLFPVFGISASGAQTANQWLTATSDNIANVNTINAPDEEPFRAYQVIAADVENGGVRVSSIERAQGTPDMVYDPDHPYANEDGMVTKAKVDLSLEMTNMIASQRYFQLNLSVHKAAVETYQQAMQIGAR